MDENGSAIRLIGTRGSARVYAIRDFLHRCGAPFHWIELENDEQARAQFNLTGLDDEQLPSCISLTARGWSTRLSAR